jgi:hypothetical protein
MQIDAIRHVWIEYLPSDGWARECNARKGSDEYCVVVALD